MPGLASADPHIHSTCSVTRMNGGSRSNATANHVRNADHSDPSDTSRIDPRRDSFHSKDPNAAVHVDEVTTEDSLSLYCKPVELYNIIQWRALRNPFFLQRCLSYKIQAAHQKSLRAGRVLFHYYFHFNEQYKTEVTEEYTCPFCLVGCASFQGLRCHLNSTHDLFNFEFLATLDHQAVKVTCRNDMLMPEGIDRDVDGLNDPRLKNFVYWSRSGRPRRSCDQSTVNAQWLDCEQQASIPLERSSSDLDTSRVQEPTSLSHSAVPALPQNNNSSGNPECSVLLNGSSTLNAELNHVKITPEILADTSCNLLPVSATATEHLDLQVKSGSLQAESKKQGTLEEQEVSGVLNEEGNMLQLKKQQSGVTEESNMLQLKNQQSGVTEVQLSSGNVPQVPSTNGVCLAKATVTTDDFIILALKHQGQPVIPEVEKNRKISIDRAEARNLALLQKRQFFHSHRAQPMAVEQLMSDRDSEDEMDNEVADIEDRRMLNDFVDVTQDEKQLMHMWNSFVRKQRVLADGHCPWACEAFSRLHAEKFAHHPALRRCLMLLLVKLWNHHLVDGGTLNRCLSIVDSYREKPEKG